MKKQMLGAKGEALACAFLQAKGYKIIERNYRSPHGEIDIIAWHDRTLVFVEVKTRTSLTFGHPEESITALKKQHLRKSALEYVRSKALSYHEFRFDVIGIYCGSTPPDINHIEAAF